MGIERRPRDFRGAYLHEILPAHALSTGRAGTVTHKCPECPPTAPRPLCPVCLGLGEVSTERLDRYQLEQELLLP